MMNYRRNQLPGRLGGLTLLALGLFTFGSAWAQEEVDRSEAVSGAAESGDEFTAAGESGAALPEMVVEAQNKVRQDIQKGSFELELSAAVVDSFYSPMEDEALSVSPVSGLQPHLNNLERLASDQPPHYWLRGMSKAPVATFFPEDPEGHRVSAWSLAITDFRGAPVKTFQGKGNPPDKVQWDGVSDRGEMLDVGYPYSYVFSVTDKGTNTYNYAGVSFRIPALDYREEGDRVLELAGGQLFSREQSKLLKQGKNWLTRAADEVRQHPYSPVRVVVVAETTALAATRADAVASFLATSMILPREQVETEAVQKADLRSELDGTVRIVIEHAD